MADVPADVPADAPADSVTARPLPRGAVTTRELANWLYEGEGAPQRGVRAGALRAEQVAVVFGKVVDAAGAALPTVRVAVLGHPEFGETVSGPTGRYDLAVPGGYEWTLEFSAAGRLPSRRSARPRPLTFEALRDVALLEPAAVMGRVTMGAGSAQLVRAAASRDDSGERALTLMFPSGVQATATMPGGAERPLTALSLRATEYTVGARGPAAMPAPLPPTSAYTYAVELTVDEAVAMGAEGVHFSAPVPVYLENFLSFPVGTAVPVGYFDRGRDAWVRAESGRVVGVVAVTAGVATLDLDGDGRADDGTALARLGITDDERRQIATRFAAGASFWRARLEHFSTVDMNWGSVPPDAIGPDGRIRGDAVLDILSGSDAPCVKSGSILRCENQTWSEEFSVSGAPWSLTWHSHAQRGYAVQRTLDVTLSGATIPSSLARIDFEVVVAGRQFNRSFTPSANLRTEFTWDGLDAWSRPVSGAQPAVVTLDWVYPANYTATTDFAVPSGVTLTGNRARQEVTYRQQFVAYLGGPDPLDVGLGGLGLSVLHAYDAISKTLYLGDGRRLSARTLDRTLRNVAGNGETSVTGAEGDGGPALAARLSLTTRHFAVAPDGTVFIAEDGSARIRAISPDGVIRTAVGDGTAGYAGDGGPATSGRIGRPGALAVAPDGTLFFVDPANHRVRAVGADGVLRTVAGNGTAGVAPDGAAALASPLSVAEDRTEYTGLAVASDGTVYFSEYSRDCVRAVTPDGILRTAAGRCGTSGATFGTPPDGPVESTALADPSDLALGRDGSLYVVELGLSIVRQVRPDGQTRRIAGNHQGTLDPARADGVVARDTPLRPYAVEVDDEGTVYISDEENHRLFSVSPSGVLQTLAGGGGLPLACWSGPSDVVPARQASLDTRDLHRTADGALLLLDGCYLRRLDASLPGQPFQEVTVPSPDGDALFVFDAQGRHLRTVDPISGAVVTRVERDAAGRVSAIVDVNGRSTRFERTADGATVNIVTADGVRTSVGLDARGLARTITTAAMDATQLVARDDGLLTSLQDPRGGMHAFTFDALGRLTRERRANGGEVALAQTLVDGGVRTEFTSATGTRETFELTSSPASRRRVYTDGAGLQAVEETDASGRVTLTGRDQSVATVGFGADPRFGFASPYVASRSIRTPSGLTRVETTTRAVTLARAADPLSLTSMVSTTTRSGRTATLRWEAATRQWTRRSPAGRELRVTEDALGRVVQVEPAGLATVRVTRSPEGRVTAITTGTRALRFNHDARGYVSGVTLPDDATVGQTRDADGRLLTTRAPSGAMNLFERGPGGVVRSVQPAGRDPWAYTWDPGGRLSRLAPPSVAGTMDDRWTWDLEDRLLSRAHADAATETWTWDAAGRPATRTSAFGVTRFTFATSNGRLSRIEAPGGEAADLRWDGPLPVELRTSGATPGVAALRFDADFRVAEETVGAQTIGFRYDADDLLVGAGDLDLTRDPSTGLVTQRRIGNVTETLTWSEHGELATLRTQAGSTSLYALDLTRDVAGRVSRKREVMSARTREETYAYDSAGHLTQVTPVAGDATRYEWDGNHHRTRETVGTGAAQVSSHDARDRLISAGPRSYTSDAQGRLSTRTAGAQTTRFEYGDASRLTAVVLPSGTRVEYRHDALGRLAGRREGTGAWRSWLYGLGDGPSAEVRGGAVETRFVYTTRRHVPDLMIRGASTYLLVCDHLGSVRLVVDVASGAVAQQIEYDAFGAVLSDSSPGFQPFGFAGGVYDASTGLVHFGLRDYDPQTGRWIQPDPIGFRGGSGNLYAYCGGDPVNRIDPSGLWTMDFYGGVGIGGGVTFGINGGHVTFGLRAGLGFGFNFQLTPCRDNPQDGTSLVTRFNLDGESEASGIGAGADFGVKIPVNGRDAPQVNASVSFDTSFGPSANFGLETQSVNGQSQTTFTAAPVISFGVGVPTPVGVSVSGFMGFGFETTECAGSNCR